MPAIISFVLLVPALLYFLYSLWFYIVEPIWFADVWDIPGIRSSKFWDNQRGLVLNAQTSAANLEKLVKQFGRTFRYQGQMGKPDQQIITLDPLAVGHILNRPSVYQKPWTSRALISALIGEGLFSSEGDLHKRQRRVSQPAFSPQNLKTLLPVFFTKANQLVERWSSILPPSQLGNMSSALDVNHWMIRATLDVIGLSAFGVDFNAIQDETHELYLAYKEMFETLLNRRHTQWSLAQIYWPILQRVFPNERTRVLRQSHSVIHRTGLQIIKAKLSGNPKLDRNDAPTKDLLSLLLKYNSSSDITESERITDGDILNQINTFLFAGSDSTSLALTWTLHALAHNTNVQSRLREELLSVQSSLDITSDASLEEYNNQWLLLDKLPYLDAVVKETLRLLPPVHSSVRVATASDIIPLSEDMKTSRGEIRRHIKVSKGQWILLPFEGFNVDREVWGDDAWTFRPERWFSVPDKASKQPGIYSNVMSFSAGPRACIGFRFSVMEMKIFLYSILKSYAISPDAPIIRVNVVLNRPYVKGEFAKGHASTCPLRIQRC